MPEPRVTILVPSHARPALLARALSFYAGFGLPLVVADSSSEPLSPQAIPARTAYLHAPATGYARKVRQALAHVRTPYLAFAADDMLLSRSGLLACAAFLDAHPDHATAHGRQFQALRRGDELLLDASYERDFTARIQAEDPARRLLELFTAYSPTYYSLQRTETWLPVFDPALDSLAFYACRELLSAMVSAIGGKHAVLPVTYVLREDVPSLQKRSRDSLGKLPLLPDGPQRLERFTAHVAAHLAAKAGLPAPEARAAVDAALALYLERECPPRQRRPFWRRLPRYAARLAEHLSPARAGRQQAHSDALRAARLAEHLDHPPALGPEERQELDRLAAHMRAKGPVA
jgi:glycosyltransferase domain-containing protein